MAFIFSPEIIVLPKIANPRGNLTFIESFKHIPFDIVRVYWTYELRAETTISRACKNTDEFLITASGSFDVVLDNGGEIKRYTLNRPDYGLFVPKMTWMTLENFSNNALSLILSSSPFDADDYIYNYNEFIKNHE
ncbi:MAG TPA: FdtA/QdtA family cupin domain-containing protein [Bacteroidales bacterium]|nr:FdtA/QdtA family cupin domain-containing protein [Bacteroidales bacterium]